MKIDTSDGFNARIGFFYFCRVNLCFHDNAECMYKSFNIVAEREMFLINFL
jgi:hypothetical protein